MDEQQTILKQPLRVLGLEELVYRVEKNKHIYEVNYLSPYKVKEPDILGVPILNIKGNLFLYRIEEKDVEYRKPKLTNPFYKEKRKEEVKIEEFNLKDINVKWDSFGKFGLYLIFSSSFEGGYLSPEDTKLLFSKLYNHYNK